MLNKLLAQIRRFSMVQPGDRVICAVSGGADSMALLWGMYLLREKLGIELQAAHFNHRLRGSESDRDEAFVQQFCHRFDIPLYVGSGNVTAGKKGLEAAAREARYAFFAGLQGKIATAHTANDNAETVLMHLVRGTGLKGLGGIAPIRGNLIRPMLTVTREEILSFLEEYHISYVQDSSNAGDAFLRNRLRHHVLPLLERENPRLAENLTWMAMELREDEQALAWMARDCTMQMDALRELPAAVRSRVLMDFLERCGVREPEREHVALAENLVFSQNPSAKANFPGGVTIGRCYDVLQEIEDPCVLQETVLSCGVSAELPELGLRIVCEASEKISRERNVFTVSTVGTVVLRCRCSGDEMRTPGGTKRLKKLFIDRKIPAEQRLAIPVIADDAGVLGVYGIGPNLDRIGPGMQIRFEAL